MLTLECHYKTLSLRKLEERAVYQRILDPTAHRTPGSQPLTIPDTLTLPEKRTQQVPAVVPSHGTGGIDGRAAYHAIARRRYLDARRFIDQPFTYGPQICRKRVEQKAR